MSHSTYEANCNCSRCIAEGVRYKDIEKKAVQTARAQLESEGYESVKKAALVAALTKPYDMSAIADDPFETVLAIQWELTCMQYGDYSAKNIHLLQAFAIAQNLLTTDYQGHAIVQRREFRVEPFADLHIAQAIAAVQELAGKTYDEAEKRKFRELAVELQKLRTGQAFTERKQQAEVIAEKEKTLLGLLSAIQSKMLAWESAFQAHEGNPALREVADQFHDLRSAAGRVMVLYNDIKEVTK